MHNQNGNVDQPVWRTQGNIKFFTDLLRNGG
jgi:hypothetical protein